jgi:hypothetical protein
MPSPFPGMDPYLETPHLWPDVHHRIISEIQGLLNPQLRPKYVARVELRVYISDPDDPGREAIIPDIRVEEVRERKRTKKRAQGAVLAITEPIIIPLLLDEEIKEARLEIRDRASDSLVTIIEILCPANKIRGSRGRASLMEKRQETVGSNVSWVEIDLLRGGDPTIVRPPLRPCDYRIMRWPAGDYTKGKYWPVSVRHALPVVGIPLRGDDPPAPLDLNAVLRAAYDHGAYDLSIDYRREPEPPLSSEDAAWADTLLREHGLRSGRGSRRE